MNIFHIAQIKNNGIPYLQVMESYSVMENGKAKFKKRPVKNLGPLSRFDDGQPEFLARLRRSFKEGKPIIEGLDEFLDSEPFPKEIIIKFDRTDAEACACQPKNIGYFILDSLYDALGIYDVLTQHKSKSKLEYDLNGLAKLLVFGRILNPDSKKGTYLKRDDYVFDICRSEILIEIYRVLDRLDLEASAIQRRMNLKINNAIGRNTELCYYDVTNYYFETDYNDSDELDDVGQIIRKGLRKRGASKQKRNKPIVQMGLFADDNGIPIAYQLFPGNTNDQVTLRPMMEGLVGSMKLGRMIVVADGGVNSGANIAALLDNGDGYILAKSVNKSDKSVKAWIIKDDGYTWNDAGTFKHKSMIRTRKIKDAQDNERIITEKVICYWSKKHYDRDYHDSLKLIEQLNAAIANPSKHESKQGKIGKYLDKQQVDKYTGEILELQTLLSIDEDKFQEYLDLMGFYTVITSELTKSEMEVIDKYSGLSKIEDSFRISKTNLDGRPVFVSTPEHVNAHFLVCFIALTMVRLIQFRILKHQGKDILGSDGWESGLSAQRIQDALVGWIADALPGGYYRLSKPDDDLKLIFDAFGVNGDLRLPTLKELRQVKYAFDKAAWR